MAQQLITPSYGVSLHELLTLESMTGAEVLAGAHVLDRTVRGVNVMEVPDIAAWVKPRELLITTGFPLVTTGENDPTDVFLELVRELHGRDVAALGIKIGRFVDEVEPPVLALADELGFPILGLPAGLGFDDLLREANARLNEHATDVLRRIDALHHGLTLVVLEGGGLDQIAAEVARVLGVGVLVTSSDGREWAAAIDAHTRGGLAGAGLIDPSGRFRVERASQRPVPLGAGELRLQPILAGGADLGRLVCVSPERPLGPIDVSAVERAATVAALLITREQAVTAVENKYRGDFLRDVFLGRAGSTEFVVEHAATLGWDLTGPMHIVLAELDPPAPSDPPPSNRVRRSWQERFAAAWRLVCTGVEPAVPTVDFTAEVVALVPTADEAADPQAARAAVARLVDRVRGDSGGGRRRFSVGVSRLVREPAELPDGYAQARRATTAGRRTRGGGSVTWFDDLGLHRLLAVVPREEIADFAADTLGELAAPTPEAADLRATLQVLLDTNLNVAEAARLQFFHYNTMRYRVAKLERILGPFTTDANLRLNLAVALHAHSLGTR